MTRRADEQKRESDLKLTEFAQLLDIRAQRIKVELLLFHYQFYLLEGLMDFDDFLHKYI